jgi:hypothetical protein
MSNGMMALQAHKQIDEARASVLVGLSSDELRRLSERNGIGQPERGSNASRRVFTYQELYQLCRLAMHAAG